MAEAWSSWQCWMPYTVRVEGWSSTFFDHVCYVTGVVKWIHKRWRLVFFAIVWRSSRHTCPAFRILTFYHPDKPFFLFRICPIKWYLFEMEWRIIVRYGWSSKGPLWEKRQPNLLKVAISDAVKELFWIRKIPLGYNSCNYDTKFDKSVVYADFWDPLLRLRNADWALFYQMEYRSDSWFFVLLK